MRSGGKWSCTQLRAPRLLGARGNSGVILSQIVRGAAEELSSRPGELIDPVLVSAALARAADAAYDSVRNPAEGTMITVVREMAHRVASELAHMKKQRLDTDATDDEQDELRRGARACARGRGSIGGAEPRTLAGAAGARRCRRRGYGVTLLIAGLIAGLRGERAVLHEVPHPPPPLHAAKRHGQHESAHFRYCTNFVVIGEDLDRTAFVSELEEFGDSVIVVGDQGALRVHVHTNQPERARGLFKGLGEVHWEDPADMFEQEGLRAARLADGAGDATVPAVCGVVAVAAGSGIKKLYEREGALVVEGGQASTRAQTRSWPR